MGYRARKEKETKEALSFFLQEVIWLMHEIQGGTPETWVLTPAFLPDQWMDSAHVSSFLDTSVSTTKQG